MLKVNDLVNYKTDGGVQYRILECTDDHVTRIGTYSDDSVLQMTTGWWPATDWTLCGEADKRNILVTKIKYLERKFSKSRAKKSIEF
ncbi:MAG: hypothetical protein A3F67_10860 [Verrucomicrobia bacterium RIFCSPHIGHO2_12_FULL_41_10]|nr:MAG: hypothetical protein A3F67_10860 [Verrucomicrobia bacterium RIFCSPHIGHO2_12_FULL_41_10]